MEATSGTHLIQVLVYKAQPCINLLGLLCLLLLNIPNFLLSFLNLVNLRTLQRINCFKRTLRVNHMRYHALLIAPWRPHPRLVLTGSYPLQCH